jgi:hypothetical protein
MRTSYRSFASRLAALELLEQAAERADADEDGPPNLALLDDDEVLWMATLGMRYNHLQVELSAPLGPVRFTRRTWGTSDAWHRFYTDLAPRATALLEAHPKPIVFLAPWEVEHAITIIDAGECKLWWAEYTNAQGVRVPAYFKISPLAQGTPLPDDEDALMDRRDICDTCDAVSKAVDLVNRQIYYPQPRDFSQPEMTTLAAWRAWLTDIGGQGE